MSKKKHATSFCIYLYPFHSLLYSNIFVSDVFIPWFLAPGEEIINSRRGSFRKRREKRGKSEMIVGKASLCGKSRKC